eukprot:18955_1
MANCLHVKSDSIFSSFIHGNYHSLLNDNAISDVQFEIMPNSEDGETHTYYGCRALFAIHSQVFRNMLFGNMMESYRTNIVRLNDMSCETFEFIQQCFYGLNPVLTTDNVVPILCTSDKYLIKPLKNLCINFILSLATKNDAHAAIDSTALNNMENASAVSMFLSSLNLLFYAQQIDVIHHIVSAISKSHSNSTKIWNLIVYDKNWFTLHHSLIKLILVHLIKLNHTMKLNNDGIQIPASKLWTQCKKWCTFQVDLIHPEEEIKQEEKDKEASDLENEEEDEEEKENEPQQCANTSEVGEWHELMNKYFKTDDVIIDILYQVNPYFFMKNKEDIEQVLTIKELNKIYEHFLYKKTNRSQAMDTHHVHSDCDVNELKLCSDNVLYLYDDFRRITRSNYGDTEFIRCASDVGWNSNIHQFTVKCYITGNQASVGVVTNPQAFIDPQSAFPFDISEVGISYYWYGSNVYGYRYGQQQFNNNIGYEWQNGDIISIIINCNKWTIQFLKNYEKIGKVIKIIPDQYYYVALCDGIYSEEVYYEGLIDYKVLVCQ